jgi:hypothetical protein
MIDDMNVHGQMPMSKLFMADNFQLSCRVPLIKTQVIENTKAKKAETVTAPTKKGAKKNPEPKAKEKRQSESK